MKQRLLGLLILAGCASVLVGRYTFIQKVPMKGASEVCSGKKDSAQCLAQRKMIEDEYKKCLATCKDKEALKDDCNKNCKKFYEENLKSFKKRWSK